MKRSNDIQVSLRPDRRLIGPEGGLRHLLVDLKAPERAPDPDRPRPPLNLALVIDVSGSMSGEPLDAACAAARGVVESLGANDRLTLVSFASDVIVHADAVLADGPGRARVLDVIDALGTRGMTYLSGGWQAGVHCLEAAAWVGSQNRLVLLSDGHANAGECDPEALGLSAEAARARGVFTSCVGIGDDYSTVQLTALADHGGGQLHHAARPEEIIEVVLGELGAARETAAENLVLVVEAPPGAHVDVLGPESGRRVDGAVEFRLGALVSGAERRVVLKVRLGAGELGAAHSLDVRLRWSLPGQTAQITGASVRLDFPVAEAVERAAELPAAAVLLEIATLWQRDILRRASLLLEEGDRDGAKRLARESYEDLRAWCDGAPECRGVLRELEQFVRRLERPVSRRLSKEMHTFAAKGLQCADDYRVHQFKISSFLDDD
jgi:Ca-activated chloride channel family protein